MRAYEDQFRDLRARVRARISQLREAQEKILPDNEGKGLHPITAKNGELQYDLVYGTREGEKVFQGGQVFDYDMEGTELIKRELRAGHKLDRTSYLKLRNADENQPEPDTHELEQQAVEPTDEFKLLQATAEENGFKVETPGTVIQPVTEFTLPGKKVKLQIAVNDDYKFPGNKKWMLVGKFDRADKKLSGTTVAELAHTLKSLVSRADTDDAAEPPKDEPVKEETIMKEEVQPQPGDSRISLVEVIEQAGVKFLSENDKCLMFTIPDRPHEEVYIPKKKGPKGYKFVHVRAGLLESLPAYLRSLQKG